MKLTPTLTDEVLLQRIGERLARRRLAQNLTQGQLAEQAGLGLRTVQRLEAGAAAIQLSGFVRVCRVLGLMDRLDLLIPEEGPGPIAQLKLHGRQRQRATGERKAAAAAAGPAGAKTWTWGGEPS